MLLMMNDNTPPAMSSRVYSFFMDVVEERKCLSVDLISRGEGPRSLIVKSEGKKPACESGISDIN